jgi:hypothetical protein
MIEVAEHTAGLPTLAVDPPRSVTIFDKKLMVALPWYKSAHPTTSFCVAQLLDKRRTASVLNFGDAFIAHSRNSIVDAFLKSDLEYLLTIDDDMIVPFGSAEWYRAYTGWKWYPDPFAGFNTIDRLMSHKKSVVGALYFGRYQHGPPVFAEGASEQMAVEARKGPQDKLFATNWVGTGCILIHRQVFLDIERRFPRLARDSSGKYGQWFTSSEHGLMESLDRMRKMLSEGPMDGSKAMKAYEMAEGMAAKAKQVSNLGVGEDVIFCRRARECGHEVFVDFGLVAGHVGYCCYGPRNTFSRPDEKKPTLQ